MTNEEPVSQEWKDAIERLLTTQPDDHSKSGDSLADMLSFHLSDIAKQAERIADALEAIENQMPGP